MKRSTPRVLLSFAAVMILAATLLAGAAAANKPEDNSRGRGGDKANGNGNSSSNTNGGSGTSDTGSGSGTTDATSGGTSTESSGETSTGSGSTSTDAGSTQTSGASSATTSGSTSDGASTSQTAALPTCLVNPPFGGIFELDGDAVNDSVCAGDDWNSVSKTFVADKIGKAGDNTYFFQGGSKDIHDVTSWLNRTNDEAPDKDDITNAYAKAYVTNGQLIVVFGADRYSNNGDAQMGFWFFQDSIGVGADGAFDGLHRVGDILVLVDFTNGGAVRTVKAYKWVASGGDVDTHLDLLATGADCRTAGAGANVCGAVNLTDADAPWDYTPKAGTPGIFPVASFFEGGINITALAPETECISSYLAETRTSQEPSARLKDFALGDFELCPSLLGSKFHDLDGDGTKDAGEPTLAGWDIHLFGTTNRDVAVHLHTVTDSNGAYSFALQPGTYTVCEGIKAGWFQSFPTSGPSCAAHPGAGGFGYTLDLGLAVEAAGRNFGNFQNATVQGLKFEDKNGNALRDTVEPAVGGIRVHIFGTTGAGLPVHQHATTDLLGTYGFSVAPGTYTLCEDIPAGSTQSFPTSGPDCAAHGDGAGGFGHSLTPASGQSSAGGDFGNFKVEVLPLKILPLKISGEQLPVTGGGEPITWIFLAAVLILLGYLVQATDRRTRQAARY